jgi:hypothetical protein
MQRDSTSVRAGRPRPAPLAAGAPAYTFTPQPDGTLRCDGGTRPYILTRDGRGGWTCSCESFRYSHRGRCKHTRELERQQAVALTEAALRPSPEPSPASGTPQDALEAWPEAVLEAADTGRGSQM